jgi:hypothetical protein
MGGPAPKPIKKIVRAVKKPIKKITRAVTKPIAPKKYKAAPAKTAAAVDTSATAAAKDTEQFDDTEVETTGVQMQKKKKGKKALKVTSNSAAANVGGSGASGLNIPTS